MSYGGRSSIGRASPCGGEGCGIVPRRPPRKRPGFFKPGLFYFKITLVISEGTEVEIYYDN